MGNNNNNNNCGDDDDGNNNNIIISNISGNVVDCDNKGEKPNPKKIKSNQSFIIK